MTGSEPHTAPKTHPHLEWLPIGPLEKAIEARGGLHALFPRADRDVVNQTGRRSADSSRPKVAPEYERSFNTWRDYYRKARQTGRISHLKADDACVTLLGVHPYAVYGDLWWEDDDDSQE